MHFLRIIRYNISLVISYLILLTLTITFQSAKCQIFPGEQNPPTIKWKQINTPHFQVIYPSTFEAQAQNMASTLDAIIERVSKTLGKQPRKISIILQNQGTTSNGFVQLAPRRSEFSATPSQAFDFQNWLNSLSVHELRHVVQFDKLTGKFNAPPLESLALAVFGITLPSWFYEGDAVTTETTLTEGGRGRIPEWYITLRTNTLSNTRYSYSKDYFGSVGDFTPGYYQLGFFMNTKLRRDFGSSINDSLLSRISRQPFRPYNFSNSVKKFSGLNTKTLHDSTISELRNLWQLQEKIIQPEEYTSLTIRKNSTPENYLLPARTLRGTTLFLNQSKAETQGIYEMLENGKKHKILTIGSQETPWFSYAAEKIVWDEFRFDLRFHQRSFNVINIFDMRSKLKRQLTHKSRLFAPAISPDGKIIAAVEVSISHQISLVEISAETGEELKRYSAPENYMLQMPSFNLSGQKIAVIAVAKTGKTILELDRNTGEFSELIPLELQEILRPVYSNNEIIFKAHFNGIDNIYKLNPATKKIYQLTSSRFGAHYPFFDPKTETLLFNNHSVLGYDISSINLKSIKAVPIDSIKGNIVNYADPLIAEEGGSSVFENIPQKEHISKPYNEWKNLFYFHSILPIQNKNTFFGEIDPGLRIQSDNKLNTLSFYTEYQYNNALRRSEYQTGFTYSKFFPVLNFSYLNRPRLINRKLVVEKQVVFIPVSWRENQYSLDITVPLLANRFNNSYGMQLKAGTSYTSRYAIENNYSGLIQKLSFPMNYELALSKNSRRSARDLAPKWGQNISIAYHNFPFEQKVSGELFTFESTFFFPGLAQNHSFQASFNFQSNKGVYNSSVDIPRVSGYTFMQSQSNTRNTLLLDYRLPLFYPDWELGPLAYIKRFKGGLFVDFENIDSEKRLPRSFGAELRADMNLLRFPLPNFDLGGKIIFLNDKSRQNPIFEAIATYNF